MGGKSGLESPRTVPEQELRTFFPSYQRAVGRKVIQGDLLGQSSSTTNKEVGFASILEQTNPSPEPAERILDSTEDVITARMRATQAAEVELAAKAVRMSTKPKPGRCAFRHAGPYHRDRCRTAKPRSAQVVVASLLLQARSKQPETPESAD